MSEKNKQVVNKVIRNEKVKVLLYPVAFFALIYGVWISVQPSILRNYDVYNLISSIVEPYQIGGLFIAIATVIFMSYWLNQRKLLFIAAMSLLVIWSVFTVSFVISPPPNTVWLLSATWTYFSFELVRRV
ncbi:hypothetical protein [Jeotgalicoccus sp. WY2]|uniref:hypothetical protein n=1 Tax=Jeotgalicoccus sp. WY2 TaxID=2708346 RepID=UPI001BD4C013|nr:hypothetical protein [Jeotgalicoccus sp. WY2]